jgi:hypothetical protein
MMSIWFHLPKELRLIIGDFLPPKCLIALAKTNRNTYNEFIQLRHRKFCQYALSINIPPIQLAAKFNLLPKVIEFCQDNISQIEICSAFNISAKMGHLNLLKWFDDQGHMKKIIDEADQTTHWNDALSLAIINNRLSIVDWLLDKGFKTEVPHINAAAELGDIKLIYRFRNLLPDIADDTDTLAEIIAGASKGGKVNVLEAYGPLDCDGFANAISGASDNCQIIVLDWLWNQKYFSITEAIIFIESTIIDAITQGILDVIKWFVGHGYRLPSNALAQALDGGHLDTINWIWDNSNRDLSSINGYVVNQLIRNNRLSSIQWLHEHKFTFASTNLFYAIFENKLTAADLLLKFGVRPKTKDIRTIIDQSPLDGLKLLHQHQVELADGLLHYALVRTRFDVATWLISIGHKLSDVSVSQIRKTKSPTILEWVNQHIRD